MTIFPPLSLPNFRTPIYFRSYSSPPLFLPRYFSRRPLDLGILSRDDLSSSENFIIIIIIISSSSSFSSSSSLEISSHRIIYFSLSLGNFSILVSIFRLILSVSTKRIVKIER